MEPVLRVLHLEDDPLDTTLVKRVLGNEGLTVEIDRVCTRQAFLEALQRGTHAIILADYTIPGMDVAETMRQARQMRPETPYIILSATVGEDVAVEMLKEGASDYVLKQRMARLVPAVRRALREREELARRQQAEEQLRQSEERFRALFEDDLSGNFLAAADGRILLCNPAFVKIFRFSSRDEATGSNLAELHLSTEGFTDFLRLIQQRKVLKYYECQRRRRDATRVDLVENVVGTFDEQGELVQFKGYLFDDTERKQAEAALAAAKQSAERAKAAAEQANRAKDHFLAVLSHELRTPLTPVMMGVSMLQDRTDLAAESRETLEMVRRNVELEARLIDDLLDVTRIARGKIQLDRHPVELCTILRRAIEVCQPDIEARQLHFGLDLGPAAPYWVQADVARLQQVFWNLLKNAIKFTPRGGCVGIRCQPQERQVSVEVADSGIGIGPEAITRVFNAFEQAERSITQQFGGLGLGLAISKALVEMHGGEISAHSDGRDKGATFFVRLPLTAPAGQSQAPSLPAPPQPTQNPLRVLLVEDHGVTAKMMRTVLVKAGHTVETAGDVATALELAGRHAFDVLLSDLGLPDGSGHDLLRQLRQRGFMFPAIALSGYGQEDDVKRSYQAGFAAHLTKPASREVVVQAVAEVASRGPTATNPGTHSAVEVPAFDANEALQRCGTAEMLCDMAEYFRCEVDSLFPQLRAALQQGDLAQVGRLGHRMKGTVAYLAAHTAQQAAIRVESFERHPSDAGEASRAVDALERECARLTTALREHRLTAGAFQAELRPEG